MHLNNAEEDKEEEDREEEHEAQDQEVIYHLLSVSNVSRSSII